MQFSAVRLQERLEVLGKRQQPLPLLDIERDRHPLQAVDRHGALAGHLAAQRHAVGLVRGAQQRLGFLQGDRLRRQRRQNLLSVHTELPPGIE
jgi:hypothetical protein